MWKNRKYLSRIMIRSISKYFYNNKKKKNLKKLSKYKYFLSQLF